MKLSLFTFGALLVLILVAKTASAACEVGQMTKLKTDIRVERTLADGKKQEIVILPGLPIHVIKREEEKLQIYVINDHQGVKVNALKWIPEHGNQILACQNPI